MMKINEVGINNRFSFEVYPTSRLGNQFKNVRLEAILNAQTAVNSGVDIVSLHANIYPSLPSGTVPNDPYQYSYMRIQHPSGEYSTLGIPWVREETIVISESTQIVLTFNNRTEEDLSRIVLALQSNGYSPDYVVQNPQ